MLELLKFNLKRIYKNKMFYLLCFIIFIAFFVLFHIDLLDDKQEFLINVDSSTGVYQKYFAELKSDNKYQLSDEDGEVIIHHTEDKWLIVSQINISEDKIEAIKKDIKEVIKERYKEDYLFMYEYIKEMDNEVKISYQNNKDKDMALTIFATIAFLLIINFSTSLANEVIYEKGSHFIKVLYVYISNKQYIFSKVLESFIVPFVHLSITVVILLINMVIRYLEDGFAGLNGLFDSIGYNEIIEININISKIVMIVVIMMVSLVLVQLIIMMIASRFTSNSQSSLFISIVYIGVFIAYFLLLSIEKEINYFTVNLLAVTPLFSMVFMPLLIIKEKEVTQIFVLGLSIATLFIYLVMKYLSATYKENMLKN